MAMSDIKSQWIISKCVSSLPFHDLIVARTYLEIESVSDMLYN
jgi:hypothetical protein